jgi:hypothetical protein
MRDRRCSCCAVCCIVGSVGAETDAWTKQPLSVKKFQRNLTTSFESRTALLLGHADGVVGGTGTSGTCRP